MVTGGRKLKPVLPSYTSDDENTSLMIANTDNQIGSDYNNTSTVVKH